MNENYIASLLRFLRIDRSLQRSFYCTTHQCLSSQSRTNEHLKVRTYLTLSYHNASQNFPFKNTQPSATYRLFSTASKSPTASFQFSHSFSPPGIPPISGNLVPSISPIFKILLIASLMPTVPYFTTSSSIELT